MNDFRKLSAAIFTSPQITLDDIAEAKAAGVTLIINNRPDGEDPEAPQGDEISAAAEAAGLAYAAIPIGHSGFSEPQIDQMLEALDQAEGKVLAYCRSGTRSAFLWALAQAKSGTNPDEIVRAASSAGYDVSPVRPMLDMLAGQAGG
ncbi:MAG: TIGR01244 family sulfur transferase [Pseudomonadota bacterium]